MRILTGVLLALGLFALPVQDGVAQARYQRGPFTAAEAKSAPEWVASEWIRGPETSLADLKDQVGSDRFLSALVSRLQSLLHPPDGEWEKSFAAEIAAEKLTLISVHTVFEVHTYQTPERLREYVAEKGMRHAVAVDNLSPGNRLPDSMIRYATRGTPEMAIIDKAGQI